MWWVWNFEARDLFRDLDPEIYHDVKHNPVMLLERLTYDRKEQILKDKSLMKRVNDVYAQFRAYMDVVPRLYGRKARQQAPLSGLLLHGVRHPLCPEDLFRWSGHARRRLCQRGFRL